MNKTVNINLAGMVFHINEDAFEILNNYLNTLKNHFKNEEGADEILKDIEGRIAELFTERLDKKEAISITDVKEVTAIMGNPSQYDDEIEENQTHEKQNKEEQKQLKEEEQKKQTANKVHKVQQNQQKSTLGDMESLIALKESMQKTEKKKK